MVCLYIAAASSAHCAVMAWKTCLLVMLTCISLTKSHHELATTSSPSPWLWITGNSGFPGIATEANTQNPRVWQPLITDESNKTLVDSEQMVKNETIKKVDVSEEVTDADMASLATWTEDYRISMAGTTPQDSGDNCYQHIFFVVGPLIVIISVIGVINNTLCIFVFWPDRNMSATTVLLLQLAVVDNITLVVWTFIDMCFFSSLYMDPPSSIGTFLMPYVFYGVYPVGNMVMLLSSWLVVYITVQRYVAVCHPHKMRLVGSVKVAWIQLVVLVIISALLTSPRFFESHIAEENEQVLLKYTSLGENEAYQLYHTVIVYFILRFIMPLTLLIFFTAALIRGLRKSMTLKMANRRTAVASSSRNTASSPNISQAEKASKVKTKKSETDNVTVALILVDIVFICCQLMPPLWRFCNQLLPPEKKGCGSAFSDFEIAVSFGAYINSSINFFIFALCGKGFRARVYQRLQWRGSSVQPASTSGTNAPS